MKPSEEFNDKELMNVFTALMPMQHQEISYTVWIIFSGLSLFYYRLPVNYFPIVLTD